MQGFSTGIYINVGHLKHNISSAMHFLKILYTRDIHRVLLRTQSYKSLRIVMKVGRPSVLCGTDTLIVRYSISQNLVVIARVTKNTTDDQIKGRIWIKMVSFDSLYL